MNNVSLQEAASAVLPVKSAIRRQDWFLLLSLGNFKITLVGFYMLSIVTILKQSGYSLNQLSLFYLLGFAELSQFMISLIIERYQVKSRAGHFRFWLLTSNIVIFLALLMFYWIDLETQFYLLLSICFILSIAGIFLASATLGLNSTILSYRERGFGGVIQVLSARSGRMIGGGLALYLYQHFGWNMAVSLMMLFSILMLIQLYFYREPHIADKGRLQIGWGDLFKRIVTYWQAPTTGWQWFLLLFFSCIPYALTATTFIPILSDQGWDAAAIGRILAVYLPIICMIVSPISGLFMRYFSRFAIVFTILLSQVFVLASFIFTQELMAVYQHIFVVQIMMLSVGYTLLLPTVMAIFMDKADKATATVDTSLQYTVMIGGITCASFLSLRLASSFGFSWVYACATIVSVATVLFIGLFCQKLFIVQV